MNPAEYDIMAEAESSHWWYRGLRDALLRVLQRVDPESRLTAGSVLDAGCGTGANMAWLEQNFSPRSVSGFDVSAVAVAKAVQLVPQCHVWQDDLCHPEQLPPDPFDIILCTDVLYTTDVAPAMDGLRTLCCRLRPSGVLVLHLPAHQWLFSQHDVAVHTRHRFVRSEVRELLKALNLIPEVLTYRMCLLFPFVALRRLPSILMRPPRNSDTVRSDVRVPPRPVNALLSAAVRLENHALRLFGRLPWGSSVIAVGRKP